MGPGVVTSGEGEDALGGRPRGIGCSSPDEPFGVVSSQPQRAGHDEEFLVVEVEGRLTLVEAGEADGAVVVLHRSAVVRVDECQGHQFGALVDVGDARHEELDDLLAEHVGAHRVRLCHNPFIEVCAHSVVTQHPRREVDDGLLIGIVAVNPGGVQLGLAHGLQDVLLEPRGRDRPGADEGLPDEVLAASEANTMSRARTSSDRLVSCVVRAVIVTGQRSSLPAAYEWKAVVGIERVSGCPPTSFAPTSLNQR